MKRRGLSQAYVDTVRESYKGEIALLKEKLKSKEQEIENLKSMIEVLKPRENGEE